MVSPCKYPKCRVAILLLFPVPGVLGECESWCATEYRTGGETDWNRACTNAQCETCSQCDAQDYGPCGDACLACRDASWAGAGKQRCNVVYPLPECGKEISGETLDYSRALLRECFPSAEIEDAGVVENAGAGND